nr:hypothetical protein [Marseillevirus cajuinensis]
MLRWRNDFIPGNFSQYLWSDVCRNSNRWLFQPTVSKLSSIREDPFLVPLWEDTEILVRGAVAYPIRSL